MRAQIAFFRKFALLYDSGVALADALRLAASEADAELTTVIEAVLDAIYRGTSLADAMAVHPRYFSGEVVGLMRAGEQRGDMGGAARTVAEGLGGGVLDATEVAEGAVEALLLIAGDARVLHIARDGSLRARRGDTLMPLPERALPGGAAGLLQRAATTGGAYMWEDRLVRVTASGESVVIRISETPGSEPDEVCAWRDEAPRLLVVRGGRNADFDGALRAVARAFDGEECIRVAVGLPVPEVLNAPDLTTALRLDPDLLLVRRADIRSIDVVVDLVASGIRVALATHSSRGLDGIDVRLWPI